MSPGESAREHAVIFYDGECGLCDRLVQFVLPRDPRGYFHFAALQSDYARAELQRLGLPTDDLDTMVLIEDGRAYVRSTAALRVLRRLKGPWPVFYPLFVWVPRPIRDCVYGLIAKNRKRLFAAPAACGAPKPGWRERFIGAA